MILMLVVAMSTPICVTCEQSTGRAKKNWATPKEVFEDQLSANSTANVIQFIIC